jgi:UDP-N-acetylglucosamine 2-epimerase (hydrolysing)
MKKKIFFLTSTRADYGKLKTIIKKTQEFKKFSTKVLVTGMHLLKIYGYTHEELVKDKIKNLVYLKNQKLKDKPDQILLNSIKIFSKLFKVNKPDLVIIHGDRIEPFALAIVCLLNNIKIAHIEGGEVSGTQDEILRHSITKLSHIHFVTNQKARRRVLQMGEDLKSVYVIGSPDMDLIFSKNLPSLKEVKEKYNIDFNSYCIAMLHPVTTEKKIQKNNSKIFFDSLKKTKKNYILFHPNNDAGREYIYKDILRLKKNKNFISFPSMRFEYFLTLLKNSNLIVGNSSAGIMEAPSYGIPSIDIGSRQNSRYKSFSIKNVNFLQKNIDRDINKYFNKKFRPKKYFGIGNSADKFIRIIKSESFWNIKLQKHFIDKKKFFNSYFR